MQKQSSDKHYMVTTTISGIGELSTTFDASIKTQYVNIVVVRN